MWKFLVQRNTILNVQSNSFSIYEMICQKISSKQGLYRKKRGHSNVLPASRPSILTWRRSWQLEDGTKVRGCQNDDFGFQSYIDFANFKVPIGRNMRLIFRISTKVYSLSEHNCAILISFKIVVIFNTRKRNEDQATWAEYMYS